MAGGLTWLPERRAVDGWMMATGQGPRQKAPASSAADGGLSLCGGGLSGGGRTDGAAAGLNCRDDVVKELQILN